MATLDKETIKNLTKLCRIDCSEEEQLNLLEDLKKIIDYINKIRKQRAFQSNTYRFLEFFFDFY